MKNAKKIAKKILIGIVVMLSFTACKRLYMNFRTAPIVWRTFVPKPRNNFFNEKPNAGIFAPVVHNNQVLVYTDAGENGEKFVMLDAKTGKSVWTWNEFIADSLDGGNNHFLQKYYKKDNFLIYATDAKLYNLDLDKGKTHWAKEYVSPANRSKYSCITGVGTQNFYMRGIAEDPGTHPNQDAIFVGDVSTGDIRQLAVPPYQSQATPTENNPFEILNLTPYSNKMGENYLIVHYLDYAITGGNASYASKMGLYNIGTNQWQYMNFWQDSMVLNNFQKIQVMVDDDKLFTHIGLDKLCCYNLETGTKLWQVPFTNDFSDVPNRMKVANGKLLMLNDRGLTAVNIQNGNIPWTLTTPANRNSNLQVMNGIAYFVGKKLKGAAIANGALLVDIYPNDDGSTLDYEDANFEGILNIIPNISPKNKPIAIVTTRNTAFAYEIE